MCLRITAPFLPSTRALSWLRLGRDLVNSISSFSSIRATLWLMNSEPLSEWKPRIRKGNWCSIAFQHRHQEPLADLADATDYLPLRHRVDGVDVVHPFLLAPVALVNRVHPQEARTDRAAPAGAARRSRPHWDGSIRTPPPPSGTPRCAASCTSATRKSPPGGRTSGRRNRHTRASESVVSPARSAARARDPPPPAAPRPSAGTWWRTAAAGTPSLRPPRSRIRPDQTRDLRQAQPRHLAQVGADRPSLLPLQTRILLMHQHPLHPAVYFGTALSSKLDPLAGLQKLPDLRMAQTLGIPHSDLHSPADRLPNTSHFQDHLVLESISVSGSSCIGQFCAATGVQECCTIRKGCPVPTETTYTSLRENLASVLDQVVDQQETVIVRRRGSRNVALLPARELAGFIETAGRCAPPGMRGSCSRRCDARSGASRRPPR